jgi:SPP1 gp7 family putative phage head morphogenesis protein
MKRRFSAVRKAVMELVDKGDVFGIRGGTAVLNAAVPKQAWRFRTDAQKVDEFRKWLQEMTDSNVLSASSDGKPWLSKYIHSAYKRGQVRSYKEAYGELLDDEKISDIARQRRMFGMSFLAPEETKRIEAMYTRSWNDLKGVTDAMGQKLSRTLSLGLSNGQNPRMIARAMVKEIDTLTKTRALVIARTEVIAAHAEGQLDGYEELGIEEVTVQAEWLTAGDDRVCDLCEMMEGEVLTIEEARGLIPRHPNCRCCWVPTTEKKADWAKTEWAIKKSIRAEAPESVKTLQGAKDRSSWMGKERLDKRESLGERKSEGVAAPGKIADVESAKWKDLGDAKNEFQKKYDIDFDTDPGVGVGAANKVEEILSRMSNKHAGFKTAFSGASGQSKPFSLLRGIEVRSVSQMEKGTPGYYNKTQKTIVIRGDRITKADKVTVGGWNSTDVNFSSAFRHEVGHVLHDSLHSGPSGLAPSGKSGWASVLRECGLFGTSPQAQSKASSAISEYAATAGRKEAAQELFAESFAAYTTESYGIGKRLPEKVEKFLEYILENGELPPL